MTLGLSPVEQRVLGCLIEKERATPQAYPLTLNALRLATNQSTNRNPVVDYDEPLLERTVTDLKTNGFLRFVYSTSNRATKYRHVLDEVLAVDGAELAVLCVLLLRGPQTAGEIKGRSERLHAFADLAEVQAVLDRLVARDPAPYVARLPRQPGQKDPRYAHLLGDTTLDELAAAPSAASGPYNPAEPVTPAVLAGASVPAARSDTEPGDRRRLDALEAEVAELRALVASLRTDLDALRSELGA